MGKKKNDDASDEFDRVAIPEFLARPLERLAGRPAAGTSAGTPTNRAPGQPVGDPVGDPEAESAENGEPVQRKWWSGYKGKFLIYGVGTLIMVFLQSRS